MAATDEFERFYAEAYARLVRQLFAIVGDLGEAEDVVQEAFAQASVRWRRVCTDDHPEAWVRRVAINRARSNLRRSRRTLAALTRLGQPSEAREISPDAVAVAAAMRRLPLRQREVLVLVYEVLVYVVELPVEETARQLGVPPGTVKSRLARGRAALARQLGEEQGDEREELSSA